MENSERYCGTAAALAAVLSFFVMPAFASIDVSPVLVELNEQHSKEVVRIGNGTENPKSFQVDVVAWSQSDTDREIYAPTTDLLAVPPLFTLTSGGEQVVRIGLMRQADAEKELSYRVFFTELEPPETEQATKSGVNVRLRFGVPVFVAPLAPPEAHLELGSLQAHDANTFVELKNTGNVRVKINEIRYTPPGSTEPEITQTVFYLHPGKSGYLPVELGEQGAGGTLQLVTDTAGVLEYALAGPQQ